MNKKQSGGKGMEGRRALPVWRSLTKGIASGPKKKI